MSDKNSEVMSHIKDMICARIHAFEDLSREKKFDLIKELRDETKINTPTSAITFMRNYGIDGVSISETASRG